MLPYLCMKSKGRGGGGGEDLQACETPAVKKAVLSIHSDLAVQVMFVLSLYMLYIICNDPYLDRMRPTHLLLNHFARAQ